LESSGFPPPTLLSVVVQACSISAEKAKVATEKIRASACMVSSSG
jgi:hypothetical protein